MSSRMQTRKTSTKKARNISARFQNKLKVNRTIMTKNKCNGTRQCDEPLDDSDSGPPCKHVRTGNAFLGLACENCTRTAATALGFIGFEQELIIYCTFTSVTCSCDGSEQCVRSPRRILPVCLFEVSPQVHISPPRVTGVKIDEWREYCSQRNCRKPTALVTEGSDRHVYAFFYDEVILAGIGRERTHERTIQLSRNMDRHEFCSSLMPGYKAQPVPRTACTTITTATNMTAQVPAGHGSFPLHCSFCNNDPTKISDAIPNKYVICKRTRVECKCGFPRCSDRPRICISVCDISDFSPTGSKLTEWTAICVSRGCKFAQTRYEQQDYLLLLLGKIQPGIMRLGDGDKIMYEEATEDRRFCEMQVVEGYYTKVSYNQQTADVCRDVTIVGNPTYLPVACLTWSIAYYGSIYSHPAFGSTQIVGDPRKTVKCSMKTIDCPCREQTGLCGSPSNILTVCEASSGPSTPHEWHVLCQSINSSNFLKVGGSVIHINTETSETLTPSQVCDKYGPKKLSTGDTPDRNKYILVCGFCGDDPSKAGQPQHDQQFPETPSKLRCVCRGDDCENAAGISLPIFDMSAYPLATIKEFYRRCSTSGCQNIYIFHDEKKYFIYHGGILHPASLFFTLHPRQRSLYWRIKNPISADAYCTAHNPSGTMRTYVPEVSHEDINTNEMIVSITQARLVGGSYTHVMCQGGPTSNFTIMHPSRNEARAFQGRRFRLFTVEQNLTTNKDIAYQFFDIQPAFIFRPAELRKACAECLKVNFTSIEVFVGLAHRNERVKLDDTGARLELVADVDALKNASNCVQQAPTKK